MEILTLKVKIAVLWIFMAVAYAAHMALSIFEPGVIKLITCGGFFVWYVVDLAIAAYDFGKLN